MRIPSLFVALLCAAASATAQHPYAPAGATFDPRVPAPRAVIGHEVGERFTPHHAVLRYFERVAAASPRVTLDTLGVTFEGREYITAVVTSERNHARLAQIKADAQRLADPRGLTAADEAALLARISSAQRVVALQGAVRAERESVIRSSGEWARSNRRLLQEALTDSLTKLHNRRYGLDRFAQEWAFSGHSGTPLSCLMLDIDHFKRVNDQYGHDVGDLVLQQIARVIEHGCRKDDVAFRFGGEEFCVVCPNTGLRDALQLGERIVHEVRAGRYGGDKQRFPVTISIGVATANAGDRDHEALVERADKALYAAKSAGRNRVMAARGETD